MEEIVSQSLYVQRREGLVPLDRQCEQVEGLPPPGKRALTTRVIPNPVDYPWTADGEIIYELADRGDDFIKIALSYSDGRASQRLFDRFGDVDTDLFHKAEEYRRILLSEINIPEERRARYNLDFFEAYDIALIYVLNMFQEEQNSE